MLDQVREVITRLISAGHWRQGDLDILVVFDAGYDVTRLAWLLKDLPAEVLGLARPRPPDSVGFVVAARAGVVWPAPHRDAAGGGRVTVPPGRPCAILRACARSS